MNKTVLAGSLTGALFLLASGGIVQSQTAGKNAFDIGVEAVRAGEIHKAFESFEPLALAGDHRAQFNLATLLKSGRGKPQNYTEALKWATLARIGGISRAFDLSETLAKFVPQGDQEAIWDDVEAQLLRFLDEGNRNVILQYALFNLEILPEPNLEIALKWQLIGAALDIDGAAEARDETAAELTQDIILEDQKETTTMFQTDDLATRFAVQPASDP